MRNNERSSRKMFYIKGAILLVLLLLIYFVPKSNRVKDNVDLDDRMRETEVPDPAHYARISLDYAGVYYGIVPSASGMGIETLVEISDEGEYKRKTRYVGREGNSFSTEAGKYSWNSAGNTITLEGASGVCQYFVAENRLFQLSLEGERINSGLAEEYILEKRMNDSDLENLKGDE